MPYVFPSICIDSDPIYKGNESKQTKNKQTKLWFEYFPTCFLKSVSSIEIIVEFVFMSVKAKLDLLLLIVLNGLHSLCFSF